MKPWAMLGLAESDGFYWSLLVHESTMTDMTGKSAGIVSNLLGGLLSKSKDGETSLAQYWLSRGWQVYADQARSSKVRQVLIQHGTPVLSYPADQVWRLAAAVDVSKEAPKIMVNPAAVAVSRTWLRAVELGLFTDRGSFDGPLFG